MKNIIKLAALSSALLTFATAAEAGTYAPAPEAKSQLAFHVAFARINRVGVDGPASVTDGEDFLENTSGVGDTSGYTGASIGVEYWYPFAHYRTTQINGTAFASHMTGATVEARGDITNDDHAFGQLKNHRNNFGIGMNFVTEFNQDMFYIVSLSAGMTVHHISGMLGDTQDEVVGEDEVVIVQHQEDSGQIVETSTSRLFGEVAVGVGKHFSQTSSAYLFLSGAVSQDNAPFSLASTISSGAVKLDPPKNWWKFGVAFTHKINVL